MIKILKASLLYLKKKILYNYILNLDYINY